MAELKDLPTLFPAELRPGEDVKAFVRECARALDEEALKSSEVIRFLASSGAFSCFPSASRECLEKIGALIEALAEECMAAAFSTWAHCSVMLYLSTSDSSYLKEKALGELKEGKLIGSTAMAPAFQDSAGLRQLGVTYEKKGGSYILTGTIRWASNLFTDEGFVAVLPARLADDPEQKGIFAVWSSQEGIEVSPFDRLLALGSTASSSFSLKEVEVRGECVVSFDYKGFLETIRPPFLLWQSAFCSGLIRACLDSVSANLSQCFGQFDAEYVSLKERYEKALKKGREIIEDTKASSPDRRALLSLRLELAELAQRAALLDLKAAGGRGYVMDSPPARRLREAAFLPVQSPTEAHLRWELSRS